MSSARTRDDIGFLSRRQRADLPARARRSRRRGWSRTPTDRAPLSGSGAPGCSLRTAAPCARPALQMEGDPHLREHVGGVAALIVKPEAQPAGRVIQRLLQADRSPARAPIANPSADTRSPAFRTSWISCQGGIGQAIAVIDGMPLVEQPRLPKVRAWSPTKVGRPAPSMETQRPSRRANSQCLFGQTAREQARSVTS